jgi:hypothetical protein
VSSRPTHHCRVNGTCGGRELTIPPGSRWLLHPLTTPNREPMPFTSHTSVRGISTPYCALPPTQPTPQPCPAQSSTLASARPPASTSSSTLTPACRATTRPRTTRHAGPHMSSPLTAGEKTGGFKGCMTCCQQPCSRSRQNQTAATGAHARTWSHIHWITCPAFEPVVIGAPSPAIPLSCTSRSWWTRTASAQTGAALAGGRVGVGEEIRQNMSAGCVQPLAPAFAAGSRQPLDTTITHIGTTSLCSWPGCSC